MLNSVVSHRPPATRWKVDHADGLSIESADWRFNVLSSITAPVLQLSVESRENVDLMRRKEVLAVLKTVLSQRVYSVWPYGNPVSMTGASE